MPICLFSVIPIPSTLKDNYCTYPDHLSLKRYENHMIPKYNVVNYLDKMSDSEKSSSLNLQKRQLHGGDVLYSLHSVNSDHAVGAREKRSISL